VELLFVTLGGVLLGLLARYSLPRRTTSGVLLVPAIGAAVAAVVWVALTWAGLPWDDPLIWLITFLVTAAAVVLVALRLGANRSRHDEERLRTLAKAGAVPSRARSGSVATTARR
jgi:quaternary ammonium compound-resistance protein SugE